MNKLNRIRRVLLSLTLVTISLLSPLADNPILCAPRPPHPAYEVATRSQENNTRNQHPSQNLNGNWEGVLDVNSTKLRVVLKITAKADNSLQATLDSPDQGATDLRVDTIVRTETSVRAELKMLGAVYEGTLSRDNSQIVGHWQQGTVRLPLVFKRATHAPALSRPQEPKQPYPYAAEEVLYENKQDGVKLAGTLTIPRGRGPHPAVLLITGSGPQDRNETVMNHRPFLVIADHLTRRGIAVLRVDDRGVGGSTQGTANDTSENYAGDVLTGVEFLKKRKEINAKQIGLLGHSEGGMIAPLAAALSTDVAFVVLLAAPGIPGDKLLDLQTASMMKAGGAGDELVAHTRRLQQVMFTILREERTDAGAESRLRTELSRIIAAIPDDKRKALGVSEAAMEGQFKMMLTPWFRYALAYDPRPTLMKLRCPVLAINGERDLQVPPKENLSAIAEALKAGGNKDYTTVELPALNHLLQTSQTGAIDEWTKIEETISPVALELIADWIIQRTNRPQATGKEK